MDSEARPKEKTLPPTPATRLRKPRLPAPAGLLLSTLLLFAGCSDNDPHLRYSYLRSAADFSVDTAETGSLCEEPGPNFLAQGFDPAETCRKTRKFVLRWERPEEVKDFQGYRLYLDTNPGAKSWKATQGDDREAAVIITDTSKAKDELVFFLYDGNQVPPGIRVTPRPDTLYPGKRRIFGLDTAGRMEEKDGRFVFGLATRYAGGGTQGQPQYTYIITHDKVPPNPFKPLLVPGSSTLEITWARPNDPTSFFDPGQDTGIIESYSLTIRLSGKNRAERSTRFAPRIEYSAGGVERTGDVRDTVLMDVDGTTPFGRRYTLPDGSRARRGEPGAADSLKVVLSNLASQDTFDIILFARDSSGNINEAGMPNSETVILTDTTRPARPELAVLEELTTKNSFVLQWKASGDVLHPDCPDEAGAGPNCRIAEYRVSRLLRKAPGEKAEAFDRRDTVITVTPANAGDSVFRDTVRFLPPGKSFLLTLAAVDVSGYVSEPDSALVTTDSILFADSGLACPSGFIPIPASRFRLGDTSRAAREQADESAGQRMVEMGSFCIEPYEHRDSLGRFMTRVTWEEADAVCKSMSSDGSTQLCSEVEWERACEGFDPARPHLHGIQSERDPGILQASCNQATGDFEMAMSFELRNPICLTNEGVHDMAGNLSEWVRDPYNKRAYEVVKDSVFAFGFTFPAAGSGDSASVHSIRGGNYLRPNLPTARAQDLARCSNRDFPMQVRPQVRKDCVNPDRPMVVVTYGQGMDGFLCFDLEESLWSTGITEVIASREDSTKVHLFRTRPFADTLLSIPPDTSFRGKKPLDVRFTPLSLAEVVFERAANPADSIVDSLDAREMHDNSQATLEKIFQRESPSSAWVPRKADGQYRVRKMYAHTLGSSKVAKPYYASRNIGFRCCSRPVPKTAPPAVAGNP